jgi:glycine cleavage system transcriptional repressor
MTDQAFAVTVVGNDRPGIVSVVARSLYEAGCNLNDATSTILRGHFTMVLIVRAPEEVLAEDLEAKLQSDAADLDLAITVRAVDEVDVPIAPPTHVVSVYGADRPGIVFRVAEALATGGANITDLTSRVIGDADAPVYALMLEVAVPLDASVDAMLDPLRAELDVDITAHLVEADVL